MKALAGFLLLAATAASAQQISGRLYASTGAVIPDARVFLIDQDWVKVAETISGPQGQFSFDGFPPALYFVQAKKPMFQLAQRHVFLKADRKEQIHLVAAIASGEDEFTIEAASEPGAQVKPEEARTFTVAGKPEGYKLLRRTFPTYPDTARRRGVQGAVVLLATVGCGGVPGNIVTLDAPDAELERVSREAFQQWRYQPMKLNGVAMESSISVVFRFKLR